MTFNKDKDRFIPSGILSSDQEEESAWKRAIFPFGSHSSKSVPQRRNNRPHWNPLIAAYKRCGELLHRDERESCFKNAIQMLFVYKLRK